MLKIASLSSWYGKMQVLKNVSLHVKEGEIISILGANGAGKTTFINSVMGLVEKLEGDVIYDEKSILKAPTPSIIRMGITQVPEGRQIFANMTVYENILLGGYVIRREKQKLRGNVEKLFSYFPILKERKSQLAGSLSGGEQQMLAIARALISDPKLILLDEPSLGLAPIIVNEIYGIIKGLKRENKTIIIVEQNARIALSVSDRGYVLENGRVILSGSGSELLINKEVIRAYLGKENKEIWEI